MKTERGGRGEEKSRWFSARAWHGRRSRARVRLRTGALRVLAAARHREEKGHGAGVGPHASERGRRGLGAWLIGRIGRD
jgi:hypothetical protein